MLIVLLVGALFAVQLAPKLPDQEFRLNVSIPMLFLSALLIVSLAVNVFLIYKLSYKSAAECNTCNRSVTAKEISPVQFEAPFADKLLPSPEDFEIPRITGNDASPRTLPFHSQTTISLSNVSPRNAIFPPNSMESTLETIHSIPPTPILLNSVPLRSESITETLKINSEEQRMDWKKMNLRRLMAAIESMEKCEPLNETSDFDGPLVKLNETSSGFFYLLADDAGFTAHETTQLFGRKFRNDLDCRNVR